MEFKGNWDKGNNVEFGQVGQQGNYVTSSRKLTTLGAISVCSCLFSFDALPESE